MADGLKRLLETEAELDALLNATARRAAELVDAARAEAEERVRKHERDLKDEESALRSRLEAECEESIRSIAAEAAREVERLDGLSDDALAELARHIVEKLVGGTPGGAP